MSEDVPNSGAKPSEFATDLLFGVELQNVSDHYFGELVPPKAVAVKFDPLVECLYQTAVLFNAGELDVKRGSSLLTEEGCISCPKQDCSQARTIAHGL